MKKLLASLAVLSGCMLPTESTLPPLEIDECWKGGDESINEYLTDCWWTELFEQAAMKFNSLVGRSLRVRGLLDTRFGPQIEIVSPDEIELIVGEENKAELQVRAKPREVITQVPPEKP